MEFYEHLQNYLKKEEIQALKDSLQGEQKYGLLLNEKKMSKQDFISMFPHVKPHPIVPNGFIYNKNEYEFGKSILHEQGVFYLQEPSAMIVSYLLNPKENEVVLDMCSAPGGKAVQASLLMNGKGLLYANDLSHQRCQALLENVERMGLENVVICNNDFEKIYDHYLNFFDKIILDAPCSGSGMFRKDDKMIVDWSYAKVLKFQDIQIRLLNIALDMLKPGGELIYSTCSLSKEEDEDVILNVLNKRDGFELINIDNPLFYINKNEPIGVHLLSFKFEGEGHYIAKIKKMGGSNDSINKKALKTYYKETMKFGDFTFKISQPCKTSNLNIIRYGVKCFQSKGKDEINEHHLSHTSFANKYAVETIDLTKDDALSYMNGVSLNIKANKGFILLTYLNIPLGYGKSDGKIIKNHYPKYLRNKKLV